MAAEKPETQAILQEIQAIKTSYETRITQLESRLKELEEKRLKQTAKTPAASDRLITGNSFNPSIGVILNGKASSFSRSTSGFSGFGVGEEGERGREGLAIDESELNFSSNIDDKFHGSTTVAIVREGGADKVELEEAEEAEVACSATASASKCSKAVTAVTITPPGRCGKFEASIANSLGVNFERGESG